MPVCTCVPRLQSLEHSSLQHRLGSQTDWASSSRTFRLCSCEARLRPHPHLAIQVPIGLPSPWSSGRWSHSIRLLAESTSLHLQKGDPQPLQASLPHRSSQQDCCHPQGPWEGVCPSRSACPSSQDSHWLGQPSRILPFWSLRVTGSGLYVHHEGPTALPHNHLVSGVTVPSHSGLMRTRAEIYVSRTLHSARGRESGGLP